MSKSKGITSGFWPFTVNMLLAIMFGLTVPPFAHSQMSIPITDEIVRQNGQEYFMHTVESGQTYFSIAHAYHISLTRLRNENPQSGDILRTGEVLRIPVISANAHLREEVVRTDRDRRRRAGELAEGEITVLEVMMLEQQTDELLTRALKHYFDPATFLVEVEIDVTTRTTIQEVPVPVIREQQIEPEEDLPGLPFIPRELLRDLGTTREYDRDAFETREVRVPEVDRIGITLRVDSVYGEEDFALMRQVVNSKIRLDPDQGDRLEIIRQPFRQATVDPAEPPADRYYYLLLAGVILLGLFFVLMAWFLMIILWRRRKGEEHDPAEPPADDRFAGALPPGAGSSGDISSSSQRMADLNREDEQRATIPSPQNYIMQVFMQQPEQIGRLFTYWHETEREDGMHRAASIIQSIDPKLLGMLKGSMSPQIFRTLEKAMHSPQLQLSVRKGVLLQQFAEQLYTRQQQMGNGNDFSILPFFDFLHYTDNDELFVMIQPESERVKALVLSHLNDQRKSILLQKLGLEEASRVLFCLPQVRTIPFHEYEKVASRLFEQRYLSGTPGHSVTEKDIDQLVSVIEALPVSDQEKYIRQLDGLVSDLADEIRKRVITMERLGDLDDETLETAVDSMSREQLAAVLVGTDEALRTRLLQFRPKRDEELIRSEMEDLVFLSRDEIDEARKKLLSVVRDVLERKKNETASEQLT